MSEPTSAAVIPFQSRAHNSQDTKTRFCETCSVRDCCIPMGVDKTDLEKLERLAKEKKVIHKGDYLYRPGDVFNQLYVIRSGSAKTTQLTIDMSEQVMGFHLPGEILGLDGITSGKHQSTCIALETANVCIIPFKDLFKLAADVPKLQLRLLKLASECNQYHCRSVVYASAIQKVAFFLLDMSQRFGQRGLSPREFNLSMTRKEIANYLGLTLETVCRMLKKLQQEQIIHIEQRLCTLLDLRQLQIYTAQ